MNFREGPYEQACALLPPLLQEFAAAVPSAARRKAEELRLRSGHPLCLTLADGELSTESPAVTPLDLEYILDAATSYSRYAAEEAIRQGYVTADGGFRIGICGTAAMENGCVSALRDFSSLSIRIPRSLPGAADGIPSRLSEGGLLHSTLILSPPGFGKTTLLRDLVRQLSDYGGWRIALVDERGELAAVRLGRPQFDVGRRTDVMNNCPKAAAIPMLLRAMNPQVIAVDEIALPADIAAMERAAHAGVALLATVHGSSISELKEKPLFSSLLNKRIFTRVIIIQRREGGERQYLVEPL